uniref:Uncharacterized protein n=1 Tax=Plectus sambesii TaxID=2011161 RepID=A0A914ULB1_9BILA
MRMEMSNSHSRSRSQTPVQRKTATSDGTMVTSRLKHFDSLLTSLSALIDEDDGSVHIAYSVVLEAASSEASLRLLAEALHQRWLSDPGFAPVAARLTFRLGDMTASNGGEIRFSSIVFVIIMNDFRDRLTLRRSSPHMFRMSAHFIFEYYALFHKLNNPIHQSLVGPLFIYLNELIDDGEDLLNIEQMCRLLHRYGPMLQSLNPAGTQQLCLKVRRVLISHSQLTPSIRSLLLEIVEMSINRWNPELMATAVFDFYREYQEESGETTPKRKQGLLVVPRRLSDRSSSIDTTAFSTPRRASSRESIV